MDQSAIQTLANVPDAYAVMSPAEYLAELYAVYYYLDADISFLPEPIRAWFEENIGVRGSQLD
ncbi:MULTISPECIES: hypothetical protein [Aliiglaciecola]|uniref:hypothetical protein n=1 Tax=Aliiglaciecola TaxID=1406885 RepID=UPI001C08C0D0|nr:MULTISPECIES: hypothetical protein [Aliiglaciecola]MBU2878718.1 hypothetical protein [Aliiglaciecola lipolytica]MDO6711385.1 hypothetical protein [Aliiglaciecola sp. 2_MG-2023]MDO6752166.1 hypothetical protein [Aliiglaciecola sp. 1_MG-2023]